MIREKTMQISGWLYNQLKIVAELQAIDCAETVAEGWLRERLEAMPEIADLVRIRADHRKAADKEWREKRQIKENELAEAKAEEMPDNQIPTDERSE